MLWISLVVLLVIIVFTLYAAIKWPENLKKMDNSLLVALIVATLTLFFTPFINKEFEKQSIYSGYILDNLKNLKLDTLAIYKEVQKISNGKKDVEEFYALKLNIEYRVSEIDLLLGKTVESQNLLNTLTALSSHIQRDDKYRIFLLKNYVNASRNMTLYLATQSKVFNPNTVPLTIYSENEIEKSVKDLAAFKESK